MPLLTQTAPGNEQATAGHLGLAMKPRGAQAGLSNHLLHHLLNLRVAMITRNRGRNNLKE